MKEKRCPYLENCFIIGSLQMLDVPDLLNYCYNNYENCRYCRRMIEAGKQELREASV